MEKRKLKNTLCLSLAAGLALANPMALTPDPFTYADAAGEIPPYNAMEDLGPGTIPEDYRQPNIVFVMLDDTGARDLGCYGSTFNETPNIDRIAGESVQFANYYSQPVCSPARSSLMTGENVLRTGITNYLPGNNSLYLNPDEFVTMPQMLHNAGYETALLGKWHLCAGYGGYPTAGAPEFHGFDNVLMSEQKYIGNGDYFYPYYHLPQVTGAEDGKYLVDHMNEEAVRYIEQAADREQPFMLYFSHYATHTVLDAPDDTLAYFNEKRGTPTTDKNTKEDNPYLAAMLKHIDDGVGMIDKTLDELGIADNTILVISSDNGGSGEFTRNGELRGNKRQIYEGGIRDPLIIRWPDKMRESKNTDCLASVTDFYQTFAEAAGIPKSLIPKNSGESLIPVIEGAGEPDRDSLTWCYPQFTATDVNAPITNTSPFNEGSAMRWGDYKYLESLVYGRRELYNLREDPSEQRNIIDENPALYAKMARALNADLEQDTVGKVFRAEFGDGEHYQWVSNASFAQENGVYRNRTPYYGISTVDGQLFYDTDISLDVKVAGKGRAGIVFRANSISSENQAFRGYAAVVNPEQSRVELLKFTASYAYVMASAEVSAGASFNVKVRTDSDEIKIFVNDELKLTHYDETAFKGTVGVISDYADAEFDNFVVTGVEGVRTVTSAQLGVPAEHDVLVTVDGAAVNTRPMPASGKVYVKLADLCNALSVPYRLDGNVITVSQHGIDVTVTADGAGTQGALLTEGEIYLSAVDIAKAFGYQCEIRDNVVRISTAATELILDTDKRIEYYGKWVPGKAAAAFGGTTTKAVHSGATAFLTFEGTGIRLYVGRGLGAAMADVYIDGERMQRVDCYAKKPGQRAMIYAVENLPYGKHSIAVVHTGLKNASETTDKAKNLNIDAFEVIRRTYRPEWETQRTKFVYDQNSAVRYSGIWSVISGTGNFGGSTTRSTQAGDSAELTFNGTGVRLYMGRGEGAGICDVYIDGEKKTTLDMYSKTAYARALMYAVTDLPSGEHTIKIVNTGKKTGIATNVNLDAFEILDPAADAPIGFPDVPVRIEAEAYGDFVKTGKWTAPEGASALTSKAKGDSLQMEFVGNGIRVYIGTGPGAGKFEIFIDGVSRGVVVCTQASGANPNALKFELAGLAYGKHTVKLVNVSDTAGKMNLNLNAFVVLAGRAFIAQ